jgi:hypothetical protein
VSKILQQLGIIEVGKTRTAGSSSGGLAQLVDHPYGPTHDAFVDGSVEFVKYCRETHKCSDNLDEAFGNLFVKLIDPKTPFLKGYNKRCSVYAVYNATAQRGEGRYRCECDSLQDTINLLRAMVYVPGWSHPRNKYTTYRGQQAYDGAFVQPLPCPPNTTYCIKGASRGWGVMVGGGDEGARGRYGGASFDARKCCLLSATHIPQPTSHNHH